MAHAGQCERCGRRGRLFRFIAQDRPLELCLRDAIRYRPVVRTAARTSLVVGTVLTGINQGNVLLGGHLPPMLLWKIPLTYCVPYCVATFAALRVSLVRGPAS